MKVALKSLSDDSNISPALVLASVACLFSFMLRFSWNDEWFLIEAWTSWVLGQEILDRH